MDAADDAHEVDAPGLVIGGDDGAVGGSGGAPTTDGLGGAASTGGASSAVTGAGGGGQAGSTTVGPGGQGGMRGTLDASADIGIDAAQRSGGVTGRGGAPTSGGIIGSGGAAATGGAVATGGTGSGGTGAACGATKSTHSETFTFDAGVSPLVSPRTDLSDATTLTSSTVGPTSNPSLCASGCAVLKVNFADGVAANQAAPVWRVFDAPANLVGATISFRYAIDNPAQVPVRVQVFATDASWRWSSPTTVEGQALAAHAAATGFAAENLLPRDDPNGFCASASKVAGLQVQNTTAITSSTAGTVTVYIASFGIIPP